MSALKRKREASDSPPQKKRKVSVKASKGLCKSKSTISITFGDAAENHVGMQKIGEMAKEGFSVSDLKKAQTKFATNQTELVLLNDFLPADMECKSQAAVLVIRKGIDSILDTIESTVGDLYEEQAALPIDTKYFDRRRKKVLNKNARGNLCFAENAQNADYANGKGTIVAYSNVPLTQYIRKELSSYFGDKAKDLAAEGNYYYDIEKCGIGFHGDAERKKVIAFRLGQTMPLHYQWFHRFQPIGKRCELDINEGDIYVMSEKATGFDWKRSSQITLRHAAGAQKYLTIKPKKSKKKNIATAGAEMS